MTKTTEKRILIIPDVHGRDFWKEPCNKWDGDIIFLGDYFDPYPSEGISIKDAIKNAEELISIMADKRVTALAGNHDCHYIIDNFSMSTRYSYAYQDVIGQMLKCMPLKLAHQEGDFLFTHAGVTKYWLNAIDKFGFIKGNLVDGLNDMFYSALRGNNGAIAALSTVGYSRGGRYETGSCVWADFYDTVNTEIYDELTQVVGHSQVVRMINAKDIDPDFNSIYYTDCHKPCILENNKIIEYEE